MKPSIPLSLFHTCTHAHNRYSLHLSHCFFCPVCRVVLCLQIFTDSVIVSRLASIHERMLREHEELELLNVHRTETSTHEDPTQHQSQMREHTTMRSRGDTPMAVVDVAIGPVLNTANDDDVRLRQDREIMLLNALQESSV